MSLPTPMNSWPSSNAPSLNYDILINIMSFLTAIRRGLLFAMMKTCRTLYNAGTLYMLEDGVRLSGHISNMYSFNNFMLQNRAVRCSLVRRLSLNSSSGWTDWCPDTPEERSQFEGKVLQDFCQIIQGCRNLRHLELAFFEGWLSPPKCVAMVWPTFSSIRTLEYVFVQRHDPIEQLLPMWADSLKWLCISTLSNSVMVEPVDAAEDPRLPIRSLHNLKALSLEFPGFSSEHRALRCPQLEALSIDKWNLIEIEHLIGSFPNIRNLHFRDPNLDSWGLGSLDATRAHNIDWQSVQNQRWPNLSYFYGSARALYTLAPQCKITHVNIALPDNNYHHLNPILQDTMPSQLTLFIHLDSDLTVIPTFPEAIDLPLTHLDLIIEVRAPYSLEELHQFLLPLLDHIGSRLTTFRLTLQFKQQLILWYFWDIMEGTSSTPFAENIVRNMMALDILILDIPFQKPEKVSYWKVERVPSEASATPILLQTEEEKKTAEDGFYKVTSGLDEFGRFEFSDHGWRWNEGLQRFA
ncbi:hypothetical protein QCA50_014446 [Cerrena zonata]|uniref:F-box domain-containing protein n=1 Tax=Cerrena zonata TaxID=2478898 RepID=A0AAW0FP88_9APHY